MCVELSRLGNKGVDLMCKGGVAGRVSPGAIFDHHLL